MLFLYETPLTCGYYIQRLARTKKEIGKCWEKGKRNVLLYMRSIPLADII